MDLDRFKAINDSCGHVAGDELLRQLGQVLEQNVRSADVVARLGGDEFAVLLHNCDPGDAEQVADNLLKAVDDVPVRLGRQGIHAGRQHRRGDASIRTSGASRR